MENLHLLKLGRGSYYDRNINIVSWTSDSKVIVGRYCSIARDCTFLLNANHRPDWVTTSTMLRGQVSPELDEYLNHTLGHNSSSGDIVIGNDVWIGLGSIIMSGVKIGDGAVIASGSVVVKDVKPYTVVGGNPAQFLYTRFPADVVKKLLEIKWWDWPDQTVREFSDLLWSANIIKFVDLGSKIIANPVRLVEIDQDETMIRIVNDTSKTIEAEVIAIETYTGLTQYKTRLDLLPDVLFYVWEPFAWKDRTFKIYDMETDSLLLEVKPDTSDHISLEEVDRDQYLKKLAKVEEFKDLNASIMIILGEHIFSHVYSDYVDVEDGDVVVDVGFNMGLFSLRALNNGAKIIHGFEPNHKIVNAINTIYPDPDKVIINECAVSDRTGTILFYDVIGSIASSATFDNGTAIDKYYVKCINLYDYIIEHEIGQIDFLKVDCEGEEYRIFESIPDEYFANNVSKILLEFHQNSGPEVQGLINKLERTGFEWKYSDGAGAQSEVGLIYAKKLRPKTKYNI